MENQTAMDRALTATRGVAPHPGAPQEVLRVQRRVRPLSERSEMALSPNALRQLEVLRNAETGGVKGSLFGLMNRTRTAFGGRLLHHWVAHPLLERGLIIERHDAVEELLSAFDLDGGGDASGDGGDGAAAATTTTEALRAVPGLLHGLPDVERVLTRTLHRTASPAELVSTLTALRKAHAHLQPLEEGGGVRAPLLRRTVMAAAAADVAEVVRGALAPLDASAAAKGDKLTLFTCRERFPAVFDSRAAVTERERELQGLLPTLKAQLRVPRLEFFTVSGIEHLIELPPDVKVPKTWIKVNSTKKFNRYHPPEVLQGVHLLAVARENHAKTCEEAWGTYLGHLGAHYAPLRAAVRALATLDCLLALASLANSPGYVRPHMLQEDQDDAVRRLPVVASPRIQNRLAVYPHLPSRSTSFPSCWSSNNN